MSVSVTVLVTVRVGVFLFSGAFLVLPWFEGILQIYILRVKTVMYFFYVVISFHDILHCVCMCVCVCV